MKIAFGVIDTILNERLGVMGLSSLAKRQGHETTLFTATDQPFDVLLARLKTFSPDLICFTATTGEHQYLLELNRRLKERLSFLSVWGGPHPTYEPRMIDHDPAVDAVCVGEGEAAFEELLRRLETGRDHLDVPNFWFRRNGSVVRNELGPLITDLDELPFPDRELFFQQDSRLRSRDSKLFLVTRGCPYLCSYCFNHAYNRMYAGKGPVMRHRSVGNVIEEVRQLQARHPVSMLKMADDTFLLKPLAWFEEFAERFPKEVGLPFNCNIRANCTNERNISLLKKAGLYSVRIGVETGDEDAANRILQRNLSNAQIFKACAILRDHDVKFLTYNILGLPVPNPLEVDMKTLDLNIALKPTFAAASMLSPYPQTDIGDYARREGYLKTGEMEVDIPVTVTRISILDFADNTVKERIQRLHKIFALVVRFPVLKPLVPLLIRLPLGRLYHAFYYAFCGALIEFSLLGDWRKIFGAHRYAPDYLRCVLQYVFRLTQPRGGAKPVLRGSANA